jgi:hypothetical protein
VAWTARYIREDRAVAWESGELPKGPGDWRITNGRATFVSGYAYINGQTVLRAGFGQGATVGGALLHELGHLMGLGHSTFPADVMYPAPLANRRAVYSESDRARLTSIGDACLGR